MNKQELVHDFIKFAAENYGIRLTMTESDGEKFEELFPDLVAVLEKEIRSDIGRLLNGEY